MDLAPRGEEDHTGMKLCHICDDYISPEDQCTCNKCGVLGHPSCQGLGAPAGDFVCKPCVEQDKMGDTNDLGHGEGKVWVSPVRDGDDAIYEYTEDMAMQ